MNPPNVACFAIPALKGSQKLDHLLGSFTRAALEELVATSINEGEERSLLPDDMDSRHVVTSRKREDWSHR